MKIPEDILTALQCEIEEVKTQRMGMLSENIRRQDLGLAQAYGEDMFSEIEQKFKDIRCRIEAVLKQ